METEEKKIKKVQAKFPMNLVEEIEKSNGYKSMNSFLKRAASRELRFINRKKK